VSTVLRVYVGAKSIFSVARIVDPLNADDAKIARTDTETFETYSAGQIANYALTYTATGLPNQFTLDIPSWIPNGTVLALGTYEQQGGSVAVGDFDYPSHAIELITVSSSTAGSVSSDTITQINLYAGLTDFMDDAGDHSSVRDNMLARRLATASRLIDKFTGREFYITTETRYLDPPYGTHDLVLRDLVSITSLTEDTDGDYDYTDQTWTQGTDYILFPYNKFPKTRLELTPNGTRGFYGVRKGLKLIGECGYGESATPYTDTLATLGAAIASGTVTSITVSNGALLQAGWTIPIGTEKLGVMGISGNTVTVRRGINGSTAAIQSNGSVIYRYNVPEVIEEQCIAIAMRLLNRGPEHGRASVSTGDTSESVEQVNPNTGLTASEEGALFPFIRCPGL